MNEFPGYKMMGSSFFLSDNIIRELCNIATTVRSVDDLNSIVSLRPEDVFMCCGIPFLVLLPPRKSKGKQNFLCLSSKFYMYVILNYIQYVYVAMSL